jgi:rhamnogalacturonyl hydrolase YesR
MAIARGLNNGWLDQKKYSPVVMKGWNALTTTFGKGGTVSNICVGTMSSENPDYYKTRPMVPDDSHGLLGVLFAGMEMEIYLNKTKK